MKNVIYEGIFFDPAELKKACAHVRVGALEKAIEFPHVTTEFKPAKTHEELYGQPVMFYVTGYANDLRNEGVQVKLADACDAVKAAVEAVSVPHITLSIAKDAKAKDTKDMAFSFVKPFAVFGTFGAFAGGKVVTKNEE